MDKYILLDLSHTDNIDNLSISLNNKKIKHLASNGCFIKLLVTDQKPSMKYSIDDPVSISNEFLVLSEGEEDPDLMHPWGPGIQKSEKQLHYLNC